VRRQFAVNPWLAFAAALISGLLGCASDAFANDPAPLDEQISQLEASWTESSGEAQYQYFAKASAIASQLFESDRAQADPAAIRLLQALAAKRSAAPEVGVADLVAQLRVARFIAANRAETTLLQQQQTAALAAVVQRIRGEFKENYEPKPVYMNVAPPSGAGLRIAGMKPDAISNRDDRAAYEEAIRENQADNFENTRQAELRHMNDELAKPVLAQIRNQARHGMVPEQTLAQMLDAPGFSSEEKASLRAAAADAARIAGR